MSRLCVLCLAAVLAVLSRLAETVGPVVRCEPCDARALGQCKPLPVDCPETAREPGCGCCMTCALAEGQLCGVYTGKCSSGLSCQHQPGETRPLQALLEGRGVCSSAISKKLSSILLPVDKQENARLSEQDRSANSSGPQSQDHPHRVPGAKAPPHHAKVEVIKREQSKKTQSYKLESVAGGPSVDTQNFSLESKRETEYGPCRREMESILNSLKITNVLNPRGFRIPNCDKKGFYKKKQCRPSKGRKRGYCWCVDKYGQPLPGYDGKERGEAQCYNLESK